MSENSKIININRLRAGISYNNLKDYLNMDNINEINRNKVKSYCRKLPVLIKTNGLLSALSFIKGKVKKENEKEKNEYFYIYSWIESWLNYIEYTDKSNLHNDIIEKIINANSASYRIYTKEAIEISVWYKRHAEAMIK
ncbi:type III-B CRISPR module-associated protein Cmr5 [Clostridium scatologenes]|uniref:CRISPR type III-B/RAMP module-associated protein Cmr5 n=1 Tax=Clostridium scatologenes TaxID=1548 RepID=A0A0E3GQ21_CLOSL|nr:type III-B CRISPR module-associated protein Cmr5 [Clostridium scatologenes]AKA67811.1 CRISPR-associated protein, Cmr5 family [Clostridium scatologenes]